MTRRVYIGNNGGSFLFRASQPGIDAVTGDITRMATFESAAPMAPKAQGTVSVAGWSGTGTKPKVTVGTGVAFSYPPFVLLKATDGTLPGEYSLYALFDANNNQITIYNQCPGAKTVKWFAFAEL
jgi:hypothetical protein